MIELDGQPEDPRNVTLRRIVLDPAIVAHYGDLDVDFRLARDEKRYVKEGAAAGPARKGKVEVERVTLVIRKGDETVFARTFAGEKAKKAESFDPHAPVEDGYLVVHHPAVVDDVAVCEALLAPLDNEEMGLAAASENKYISTAATILREAPFAADQGGARLQDRGEDDDD
jgi:hypothetical protein